MIKCNIDIATIWSIRGWVYDTEQLGNPVDVDILVNNHVIAHIKADIKRPGLVKNGSHPTGLAGFYYYLGDKTTLSDGDKLKIACGADTLVEKVIESPTIIMRENCRSVLIVGQGKSGTSKLTYVVESGMPEQTEVYFEPTGKKLSLIHI